MEGREERVGQERGQGRGWKVGESKI